MWRCASRVGMRDGPKAYRCQVLVDDPSAAGGTFRHDLREVEQWMALPILKLCRQLVTQHEDRVNRHAAHLIKRLFNVRVATKRATAMRPNALLFRLLPCFLLGRGIRINL